MWKSEKLIQQEKQIDELLAKLKPINEFEADINGAMANIDQANALIRGYLWRPTGLLNGH